MTIYELSLSHTHTLHLHFSSFISSAHSIIQFPCSSPLLLLLFYTPSTNFSFVVWLSLSLSRPNERKMIWLLGWWNHNHPHTPQHIHCIRSLPRGMKILTAMIRIFKAMARILALRFRLPRPENPGTFPPSVPVVPRSLFRDRVVIHDRHIQPWLRRWIMANVPMRVMGPPLPHP